MIKMNEELGFLDLITIISFLVGLQNLEENITQGDLQDVAKKAEEKQSAEIREIHEHLTLQDKKIDNILKILKANGGVIYDR